MILCRSFHPILPISYLQPLSLPLEISRPSLGLISASRNLLFRTMGIAWPHHTTAAKDTMMGFYTVNKAMREKGQTNVCIKKLCAHLFISIKNYWCDQSKFCTHGNTNVNIVMSEIRFDIKVVINPNWTIIIPPSLPPPHHRLDKWRKTLPPSFPAPPPPPHPHHRLDKGKETISSRFLTLLNLLSNEICHPWRVRFWNLFRRQSTGL